MPLKPTDPVGTSRENRPSARNPRIPSSKDHWRTTVATVVAAGLLNDGRTLGNGSERVALASRWEAMRQADMARHELDVGHDSSDDDDLHRRRRRDRDNDRSRDVGFGRRSQPSSTANATAQHYAAWRPVHGHFIGRVLRDAIGQRPPTDADRHRRSFG